MCHRRSGGCTTAYSDAPAATAADRATWSVPASRLPPWKAMRPNGERSSHSSSTPSWARSSANIGLAVVRDIGAHGDERGHEGDQDQVAVLSYPRLRARRPARDALARRVRRVAADLEPPVPRDVRAGEHE